MTCFKQTIFKKIVSFWMIKSLFVAALAFTLSSCGNLSTSSTSEGTLKDVAKTATVEEGQATSLAIDDGSASGTEIEIPADELPAGTTLTLDRVDAPAEFTNLAEADADGETKFVTASSVISVQAGDTEQLTNSMSLSIPYSGANLALMLLGVEKSTSNLCILHLSKAGQMYVFRNNVVNVDAETRKVKFGSKTFGIFQVIFCGDKEISEEVADASESSIAGVPPGSDTESFSSYGSKSNLNLTVDGSKIAASGKHMCILIGSDGVKSDGNPSDSSVIHSATLIQLTTTAVTAKTEVDTKAVPDLSKPFVAFLIQSDENSCGYNVGDTFTNTDQPKYSSAFAYPVTKRYLSTTENTITLGSEGFEIDSFSLTVGPPAGNASTDASAPSVSENCIEVENQDNSGNSLRRSGATNFAISGTIDQTITIFHPKADEDTSTTVRSVVVNKSCQTELLSYDFSSTYKIQLQSPGNQGNYYIRPIDIGLSDLNVPATLSAVTSSFCIEVHSGDFLSGNAPTHPSTPDSSLGRWNITSDLGAKFFLPYPGTASATARAYDLLISPAACSNEAPSTDPFVLHDRALH